MTLASASFALVLGAAFPDGDGKFAVTTLDPEVEGAALVRGADRVARLVVATPRGLSLVAWNASEASNGEAPQFPIGDDRLLAYCVAGHGENERVFVLDDHRRVRTWNPRTLEVATIVTDADAMLPSGVYPLRFARDLDGDGAVDLAIPVAVGFQLYFATNEGMKKGPRVEHRMNIDVSIKGYLDRDPYLGQSIVVRDFDARDQNGDGHPDLAFRDEKVAQFYWSDRDGHLPTTPTFTVDIEKIQSALPKAKAGLIDTHNILSILDSKVSQIARDVDGDGISDLVVQKGKTVVVYRGTRDGIDMKKAAAVLPTSGNLLAVALYDEDGDGKLDLFMLHVGDISLAQVLFWLVASGDLQVELFVYRQDKDKPLSFARKPSSRRTVTISLPSAKSTVDKIKEETKALRSQLISVPAVCDFDGDGKNNDLALLTADGKLEVHTHAADDLDLDDALSWNEVAKRFDRDAKGKTELTIGLHEVVAWLPLLGVELNERAHRAPPVYTLDLASTPIGAKGASALFALDLDGDGKDDFALLERDSESAPPRLLFVVPR